MNPADLFDHETEPVLLKEGEALFHEGDEAHGMYVLLDGNVVVLVGDVPVENATRGALLGEMALVDSRPRTATVMAVSPCRLATIDERRFHFMVQHTPNFASHVMRVLVQRLRQMNSLTRTTISINHPDD